jgi:hypothetical protein
MVSHTYMLACRVRIRVVHITFAALCPCFTLSYVILVAVPSDVPGGLRHHDVVPTPATHYSYYHPCSSINASTTWTCFRYVKILTEPV